MNKTERPPLTRTEKSYPEDYQSSSCIWYFCHLQVENYSFNYFIIRLPRNPFSWILFCQNPKRPDLFSFMEYEFEFGNTKFGKAWLNWVQQIWANLNFNEQSNKCFSVVGVLQIRCLFHFYPPSLLHSHILLHAQWKFHILSLRLPVVNKNCLNGTWSQILFNFKSLTTNDGLLLKGPHSNLSSFRVVDPISSCKYFLMVAQKVARKF